MLSCAVHIDTVCTSLNRIFFWLIHIYLCFFLHSYLYCMNTVCPSAPFQCSILIGTSSGWYSVRCYHCLCYHCCPHCIGVHLQRWVLRMHVHTCKHTFMHTHTLMHPRTHVHTHCVHLLALCMYYILLPLASYSPDKCCKVRSKDSDKVELTVQRFRQILYCLSILCILPPCLWPAAFSHLHILDSSASDDGCL